MTCVIGASIGVGRKEVANQPIGGALSETSLTCA